MNRLSVIISIIWALSGLHTCSVQAQNSKIPERDSFMRVNPFRIEIITPSSGVQFYRDGIVFLSHSAAVGRMLPDHISFGKADAYYVVYDDTIPGDPVLFSSNSTFEVPCEAMTFNSDYSVMYYTKRPSLRESEKIYRAKFEQPGGGRSGWVSEDEPINICDDVSSYSHPALSPDGELMVFVSDRKISSGGLDIFITRWKGTTWSPPENAGNHINTSGDEFSPFLDHERNLFFSSDGHKGSGGFDIYFCRYNGSGWDKPANLTGKINTQNDELAFTMNRIDGKSALFTRRQNSGSRAMKMFRITFRDQAAVKELTNLSNALEYLALGDIEPEVPPTGASDSPVKTDSARIEPIETTVKKEIIQPSVAEDVVIYRVQFASGRESKESYEIIIEGNKYKTFEYLYNGAYRYCAGEFSSHAPAVNLMRSFRENGYNDAFIVAFKNDIRLPTLPKSELVQTPGSYQAGAAETRKQDVPAQIDPETQVTKSTTVKNAVVFRVQFSSGSSPKGSSEIMIRGNKFKTFEYFYNGAYRICAGEYDTYMAASVLQLAFKQEGFKDAFVVAFKNNVRTLDPALFKK